jgi:hypothetical protein
MSLIIEGEDGDQLVRPSGESPVPEPPREKIGKEALFDVLKRQMLPALAKQLVQSNALMRQLERAKDMEITGRQMVIPVQTARNVAAAYRGDEAFPEAGHQGYAQIEISREELERVLAGEREQRSKRFHQMVNRYTKYR